MPQLDIRKGKTVFLLGPSGIGKSTFIEAIGLMNDTMRGKAGTSVVFYDDNNRGRELKGIWKGENDDLSAFRNRYYSFIFQHTNLMPNFTAGENMCISRLIRGVPLAQARQEVLATMEELRLEGDIFYKKTTHLSGGQRQRVAFVRAITAEFEVLFGDEPTGNLDKDTAFRLMAILKNNLERHHRTAIIVSHDLGLALHFADQIVLMTFHGGDGEKIRHGIIRPEHVIENRGGGWYDVEGRLLKSPATFVAEALNIQLTSSYA